MQWSCEEGIEKEIKSLIIKPMKSLNGPGGKVNDGPPGPGGSAKYSRNVKEMRMSGVRNRGGVFGGMSNSFSQGRGVDDEIGHRLAATPV